METKRERKALRRNLSRVRGQTPNNSLCSFRYSALKFASALKGKAEKARSLERAEGNAGGVRVEREVRHWLKL
jgi:hypothetical protein